MPIDSPEVEEMIEEAVGQLYARAVAMHESLIAGRGAVDFDDKACMEILRDLVRQAIKAHHKQPWHECLDCTRWFQQDYEGAVENARLSAALATVTGERDEWRAAANIHNDTIGILADKKRVLEEALRKIAEGNLGPQPWQADYERIREVARKALSPASSEGAAAGKEKEPPRRVAGECAAHNDPFCWKCR